MVSFDRVLNLIRIFIYCFCFSIICFVVNEENCIIKVMYFKIEFKYRSMFNMPVNFIRTQRKWYKHCSNKVRSLVLRRLYIQLVGS